MTDSSQERPDDEREGPAGTGRAVRDAAALYRQIWGTDPEPRPSSATRTRTPPPAAPAGSTAQEAGSDGPSARDLPERLAALERLVGELNRQFDAEGLEVVRAHGRAISSLEKRLAAVERELGEFTRSFNGRIDRIERALQRLERGLTGSQASPGDVFRD